MANELDKFVLEYVVEIRDSLKKLDQLQKKMEQTQKTSSKVGSEMRDFAADAGNEIGKLVPGVEKVTSAVRAMGAEFSLAAVGIAAIGVAIKSVIDMRELYNAQRKQGQEAGIGTIRAEEYRRKFRRFGEGRVDDKTAADTVKKIADIGMAAYMDPTRMSAAQARQLRMLGIPIGKGRNGITSTNQLMGLLGQKFAGMSAAEVQGVAGNLGIDRNAALAMRAMGKGAGEVTELSRQDITNRIGAQDTLNGFNKALSDMDEKFKELSLILGEKLIPYLTDFVNGLDKIANALGKSVKQTDAQKAIETAMGPQSPFAVFGTGAVHKALSKANKNDPASVLSALKNAEAELLEERQKMFAPKEKAPWYAPWRGKGASDADKIRVNTDLANVRAAEKQLEAATKNEATGKKADDRNDLISSYDEAFNESARDTEAQFGLAVNMFAGAVASFSNAIDEKQAWAAWAGEVGRAAGLGSTGGEMGSVTRDGVPAQIGTTRTDYNRASERAYEGFFEEAAAKYNIPVSLLKAHARVESGMNPNAVSSAGAEGLMQLLPSTARSLGVKDSFDPQQNIMGAAKLIRENLDRYGNTNDAIMAYHGGTNQANWGPKTRDYLAKVNAQYMAENGAAGGGMSAPVNPNALTGKPSEVRGVTRSDMQKRMVQSNIAGRLGVPLQQLQLGEVNRGDVEFAASQLEGGVSNNIYQLNKQAAYAGLPASERTRLETAIRDQSRGLDLLGQQSAGIVGEQQQGGRSITLGERAVIINIDGSKDPHETANAVSEKFRDSINEIANGASDGVKY